MSSSHNNGAPGGRAYLWQKFAKPRGCVWNIDPEQNGMAEAARQRSFVIALLTYLAALHCVPAGQHGSRPARVLACDVLGRARCGWKVGDVIDHTTVRPELEVKFGLVWEAVDA